MVWPTANDGVARSKLIYKRLREIASNDSGKDKGNQHNPSKGKWKHIWRSPYFPKVNTFIWRARQGALPMKNELARREVQISQSCPFCESEETVEDAMLSCSWVRGVSFGGMGSDGVRRWKRIGTSGSPMSTKWKKWEEIRE